ncbi:MAG TPA: cytochrome c oxidase subunit 3 [Rubricoccaceae bacterium]|nr:cytochrome c oxidase subunit 3 [Rubricoccaceae bacterium]
MKHIDASLVPSGALDHRGVIWWGNLLLLVIETTMFALLVAVYLYLRQNTEPWPPPRVQGGPPFVLDPNPSLLIPTINLFVLLVALVPTYLADKAAHNLDWAGTLKWDALSLGLGWVAVVLRFFEFEALHFTWDENAYASIVWMILGVHLAHILVVLIEEGNTAVWVWRRGIDKKHALDMRVSTIYYYWVVGTWVLLYPLVYLLPRVI